MRAGIAAFCVRFARWNVCFFAGLYGYATCSAISYSCDRQGVELACSWELFSTVIWDVHTTRCIESYWFFSIWSIEQFFLPYNRCPWWTGPTRPAGRNALWRGISQSVQKIKIWNFWHNVVISFKIVLSNFGLIICIGFEIIAFLLKPVYCLFSYIFGYNSGTTWYFENLIVSHERTSKSHSESLWFLFA